MAHRFKVAVVALIIVAAHTNVRPAAAGAKDARVDGVLAYFKANVVDRTMVTTQWEPKQKESQSGKEFQRTFTRTSWYCNARKTDFGMTVEYRVVIDWKTFNLDGRGKPEGDPYDLTSYDTKFEIALNAYPGHSRLVGVCRAVESVKDKRPRDIGPSDYDTVAAYLSTDDANRPILRMDVRGLFPRVTKMGPGKKERLVAYESFETVWLEDGKLHRRQLWRDYHVDPHTLERSCPLTEEKEVYEDSE
jgi:hypothetical protein